MTSPCANKKTGCCLQTNQNQKFNYQQNTQLFALFLPTHDSFRRHLHPHYSQPAETSVAALTQLSPTSRQTCRSGCCGCMCLCPKQSTLSNLHPFQEGLCSDHEDRCQLRRLRRCCPHSGNPGKHSSSRSPSGPSCCHCIEC